MIVWIVGTYIGEATGENMIAWDIMGVFETEAAAGAACTAWEHFVGPIALNQRLPDERHPWEGCYYPLARAAGVD